MRVKIAVFTVIFNVFLLFGQTIELRGRVINQAREPVNGLEIILAKAGVTDTTDANGRFEFDKIVTAVRNRALNLEVPARVEGSQLVFSVEERRQNVSVALFDIKGSKVAELVNKELASGEHRIPIIPASSNRISTSMLIMVLKQGNRITRFQLMNIGGRYRISAMQSTASSGRSRTLGLQSSDPFDAVDTLIIERRDTLELRMVLSSYQDTLSIQLDLIPWEVLELALHEEGKGPLKVGEDMDKYPFAITNYLAPNEAWCSEFVAWVYRATDYPLTGGSEGGWMVRSSEALKQWFQKNSRFVSHTDADWQSFEPSPGDYIRYAYETAGGHSGIVRYAEGSTLYTVEGNVNNMVMLRTIKNYKNFSQTQVDGIGMRSGYLKK